MHPNPPHLNEAGRAMISLPPDATIHSGSHYLAIAFDATPESDAAPVILGGAELPFMALWELLSLLCGDRAQRTVDGTLLAGGRPVTPEAYLKLWRDASAAALTPEQFATRYGLVPTFLIEGSLLLARGCERAYTSSPFAVFDDFETACRDEMQVSEDGTRFVVTLDARRPNAARDAYYGASFLSRDRHPQGRRTVGAARTELRRIETSVPMPWLTGPRSPAPQRDLFAFAEG